MCNKPLKTIMFVLVLVLMTWNESNAKDQMTIEQVLIDTARDLNKKLPMSIDDDSTIENVAADKKTLVYTVTLLNPDNRPFLLKPFREYMKPYLASKLCSDKGTRASLNYGVIFRYVYYNKSGKRLTALNIDSSNCKK